MKSYGVTIQLKPLQQYFSVVPFAFHHFKKSNLEFCQILLPRGVKRLRNCWKMCHENEASRELHEMDAWITALSNENHDR